MKRLETRVHCWKRYKLQTRKPNWRLRKVRQTKGSLSLGYLQLKKWKTASVGKDMKKLEAMKIAVMNAK